MFAFNTSVYAASSSISVSSGNVYVGDSFTVSLYVTSSAAWNVLKREIWGIIKTIHCFDNKCQYKKYRKNNSQNIFGNYIRKISKTIYQFLSPISPPYSHN